MSKIYFKKDNCGFIAMSDDPEVAEMVLSSFIGPVVVPDDAWSGVRRCLDICEGVHQVIKNKPRRKID